MINLNIALFFGHSALHPRTISDKKRERLKIVLRHSQAVEEPILGSDYLPAFFTALSAEMRPQVAHRP